MNSQWRFFLLALVACWATAWGIGAQEPAPPADATKVEAPRELNIYVPYDKLREVFEKHGRGVFLPYDKFQELWQAARQATQEPEAPKPPVGALVSAIRSEATVEKDVVRVAATLSIEVLGEGWTEVPLRLADAAITRASVGETPARIVGNPQEGYKLLVHNETKAPQTLDLKLEYAKAITRSPGLNSVGFQAPEAPVNLWRVVVPQAGVKVEISPMIAATEEPAPANAGPSEPTVPPADPAAPAPAAPAPAAPPADQTVLLAFVGAAPTVEVRWTPKAEGATGLEALASVQAEQQVWVNQGVTRTRARLVYTISRAELAELAVDVPTDQKVVNVFDANVRQWTVAEADGRQRIAIQLFEPAKQVQEITVELEKFSGEQAQASVAVPMVRAQGVGRQQGVVVVQVAGDLRAEATQTSGLLQVDAAELPQGLQGTAWTFAYRYAAVPYELALDVEQVAPRILADTLVEAYLDPEKLTLDATTVLAVERAGVFRLELDVPAGYAVRTVEGRAVGDAAPVAVEGHHLEGDSKTHLVVNLAQKALGRVALGVVLEKDLDAPALLTPEGEPVDLPVELPRVAGSAVEQAVGKLLIYAPESLRVNPAKAEGIRTVSFAEAVVPVPSMRGGRAPELRPVLAYAYTRDSVDLALSAQRRKPQVTMAQLLVARIENGVVKYESTFYYEVLYSGVKSLRIDVPEEIASRLRNTTPGIRERKIDAADADPGYVAWSFAGESELLGQGEIRLSWETKIDELQIGKSVALAVPRLVPREVDRQWGQIVLTKTETIDVEESGAKELLPIDPQHELMRGVQVEGAAQAFEFHAPWELKVSATQYELEDVKLTSIERAVVRMVVTRDKELSVQALYRMRSALQRIELRLPKTVQFDLEPLRLNGQPVVLERGSQGEYFVPLVDPSPDRPFLLELRYTLPGDTARLELPEFPGESPVADAQAGEGKPAAEGAGRPAVQKVFLSLYLPDDQALVRKKGPWTEEFAWHAGDQSEWKPFTWEPCPTMDDGTLIRNWLLGAGDIAVSGDPSQSFQVDGRRFVFSSLRPPAPPAGGLAVRAVSRDLLNGVTLGAIVLLGLVLLPLGAVARTIGLALAAMVVAAGAVFEPLLAWQILDGGVLVGLAVVALLWIVRCLARWLRRRERKAEGPPPASAPAPLPPTAPPPESAAPSKEDVVEADLVGPEPELPEPPASSASAKPEPPKREPASSPEKGFSEDILLREPDDDRKQGGPAHG